MKKIRKIAAVILALALCLSLCACRTVDSEVMTIKTVTASNVDLYDQALEHVAVLEEMLNSSDYLDMMTTAEGVRSVLEPYQGKEFGEPDGGIYKISFSEDAYSALLHQADLTAKGFSEPLELFVTNRVQSSVMTMMNAAAGAETVAASSILTYSCTYVGEALENNCILLLCYHDACPVMVSFAGIDGAVQASSALLMSGALESYDLESVQALFGGLDMEDAVTVQELEVGH